MAHIPNDNNQFPKWDTSVAFNLGTNDDTKWYINEIIGHHWKSNGNIEFRVQWTLGDIIWESLQTCNELVALDSYLELQGIMSIKKLTHKG